MFELRDPSVSTERLLARNSSRSVLDSIADEYLRMPEDQYADLTAERLLEHWLDQLSQQQREVVDHRFGLQGHGRRTLEEVGKLMGVTRERVRQIQMSALSRLKQISTREGYLELPSKN